MSKANYKFLTRPNFPTNHVGSANIKKNILSKDYKPSVGITRNLGGCKLFLNSLTLSKKN